MLRPLTPASFIGTLLLLGACAPMPARIADPGSLHTPVELDGTPFFAQDRYQCGPAALATVLIASGADISLETLIDRVYLPGRRGSLQVELLGASRSAGRIPYVIDGTLEGLAAELRAGRPVLVLQNLGVSWYPRWHYAVVVGVDPVNERVVLRSGTVERRVTQTRTFLATWRRGGYWGFVVLTPGELPARPDTGRYYDAVAAVEATGHPRSAREAWRAAVERWPDDAVPLFGLANAELALGEFRTAEARYRSLIARNPGHLAARNNLAYALSGQGRNGEAVSELERAIALAGGQPALAAELADSLEDLRVR